MRAEHEVAPIPGLEVFAAAQRRRVGWLRVVGAALYVLCLAGALAIGVNHAHALRGATVEQGRR